MREISRDISQARRALFCIERSRQKKVVLPSLSEILLKIGQPTQRTYSKRGAYQELLIIIIIIHLRCFHFEKNLWPKQNQSYLAHIYTPLLQAVGCQVKIT